MRVNLTYVFRLTQTIMVGKIKATIMHLGSLFKQIELNFKHLTVIGHSLRGCDKCFLEGDPT